MHMVTTTPERVNEEINKCAVKLSNLRAQKNSFLPISRLSPETLANVFIHAACDYHEHSYRLRSFRVPHWVNVSYVCRHWRNVALNCPTLWAYHFTVSPRWTTELLARSKQASLKIQVECSVMTGKSWCSRLLENVLSQAGRIQELRLNIPHDILPTEISLDAPRLQMLDIDFSPHAPERTFSINNGDSLLHTLILSYCPLLWHSTFNLSSVTILSLCCIPPPSQQEIPEFLTTLTRMQGLTILHVERSLPAARDFLASEAFDVSPKVTLPCLARIVICAPLSTVIALLSCVIIPLKTQVRLDIEEDDSAIDDYAQLPSLIACRFSQSENPSSSSPIIRSLIIHFTRDSMFTLSASELGDCGADMPMQHGPQWRSTPLRVHVNMKQSIAISDRARIAGDIFRAVPSTHIQILQISDPPSSPDLWRMTLGHLNGLRYIRLGHGTIPSIASLLDVLDEGPEDAISSDQDRTQGYTFVPALEELELYRMWFSSMDDMRLLLTLSRQSTRKALDFTISKYEVKRNEY